MEKTAAFDSIKNLFKRTGKSAPAKAVDLSSPALASEVAASEARSNEHVLKMRDKIDAQNPPTSAPKALPSKATSTAAKVGVGVVGAGGLYAAGKHSGQNEPQGFKDTYFTKRAFVIGALRSATKQVSPPKGVSSLEHFTADTIQGAGQDKIREKQKEREDILKVAKEVLKRDQDYINAHRAATGLNPLLADDGIDAEYERAAMFGTPAAVTKAITKNWEDRRKLTDDVSLARSRRRNEGGTGAAIGAVLGAGLGLTSAAKSKNPAAWKQLVQGTLGGAAGATAGAQIGAMPGRRAEEIARARLKQEEYDDNVNRRTLKILRSMPGNRYEEML